jgi:hypothetical protein
MKIEGFNTEILNGVYNLLETKNLDFQESQSIFKKDNLQLLLWYDFNKEMYGGRISSVSPLRVFSFYDMKKGWSDNGTWCKIKITP